MPPPGPPCAPASAPSPPPRRQPEAGLLRFPSSARLRRAGEFARLKREGRTVSGRLLVLSVLVGPEPQGPVRLGLITTRRLGGAVVRNRVRRRLREIFRAAQPLLRPGFWLVLIARPPSAGADFSQLRTEWETLARRSGLLLA